MNELDKIEMPGMLLIGAAARGSGKTALATKVISRFARDAGVAAAKVTALEPVEARCPRGGHGEELCLPLSEGFCVIEEEDREGAKDTSRLLAAGARKVFWLQSLKTRLRDGAHRLRELIGAGSPWICESNSLRQVVRPDVFLMVRESQTKCFKPSAEAARSYADMVISFDPENFAFDFDLSRLALIGGRWTLRLPATAVILAGVDSRGIESGQAMLPVSDKPLMCHLVEQLRPHFDEIMAGTPEAGEYGFPSLAGVPEKAACPGPLAAVAKALDCSSNEINFVTARDIPEVDQCAVQSMVREIRDCDAVVPRAPGGLFHPLFAVYRKSVGALSLELLKEGKASMRELFGQCRVKFVDWPPDSGTPDPECQGRFQRPQ